MFTYDSMLNTKIADRVVYAKIFAMLHQTNVWWSKCLCSLNFGSRPLSLQSCGMVMKLDLYSASICISSSLSVLPCGVQGMFSYASDSAEDEHHFVFDCPAYCAIRNKFTNIFWGPAPTLSSFFTLHDPKVIARFLKGCFEHRNTLVAAQTGHNL